MANSFSDEHVEIEYDEIVEEREKAWKLWIGYDEVWLPKSQCYLDEKRGLVGMPHWLARKKGLIEE